MDRACRRIRASRAADHSSQECELDRRREPGTTVPALVASVKAQGTPSGQGGGSEGQGSGAELSRRKGTRVLLRWLGSSPPLLPSRTQEAGTVDKVYIRCPVCVTSKTVHSKLLLFVNHLVQAPLGEGMQDHLTE